MTPLQTEINRTFWRWKLQGGPTKGFCWPIW